jgi:hypothetical protein
MIVSYVTPCPLPSAHLTEDSELAASRLRSRNFNLLIDQYPILLLRMHVHRKISRFQTICCYYILPLLLHHIIPCCSYTYYREVPLEIRHHRGTLSGDDTHTNTSISDHGGITGSVHGSGGTTTSASEHSGGGSRQGMMESIKVKMLLLGSEELPQAVKVLSTVIRVPPEPLSYFNDCNHRPYHCFEVFASWLSCMP